jgi:uncharacterized membrane protein YccC
VRAVRSGYQEFLGFVAGTLRGRLDRATLERSHEHFVTSVIALEAQRESVYFESPDMRVRSGRLRLLNAEFMAATTGIYVAYQLMQRLRLRGCHRVLDSLAPLYHALADELLPAHSQPPATPADAAPVAQRLAVFRTRLPQVIAVIRQAIEHSTDVTALLDFDSAAELLRRLAEESHDYSISYVALAHPGIPMTKPAPDYVPHADLFSVVLNGVRATAALLAVTAFWFATAWPNGADAATLACVFCCLFAVTPEPVLAVRKITFGLFLGLPAAFVCGVLVLPRLDGFPLLAAGMLPFLAIGVKLLTAPRTFLVGLGYNILFVISVGVENVTRFDPTTLLNDSLALLLGGSIAGLAFALLVPTGNRRLMRSLRMRAQLACVGPLHGLRHRFENSTRDLLSRLLANADRAGGEDRLLLRSALSVLEIGRTVIGLRQNAADCVLEGGSGSALRACMCALARLLEEPSQPQRERAVDGVIGAAVQIDHSLDDADIEEAARAALSRVRVDLHVLRIQLLDDEMFAGLSSFEKASHPGVSHAP